MSIILPGNVELDTYESQYTPEQIEAAIGKGPIVQNGTWWVWSVVDSAYQDTGVYAAPGPGSIVTEMLADGAVTWPKLAPEARKSNDNLLDNAYFIGGGSQRGGGHFPINQRGLTEVVKPSAGMYGLLDRWKVYGTNATFTLLSDGIEISTGGGASCGLIQIVESSRLLPGRTYTLSCLFEPNGATDIFLSYGTGPSTVSASQALDGIEVDTNGRALGVFTFTLADALPDLLNFRIRAAATSAAQTFRVIAMKLELGPNQTLAHESAGGGWQLNNLPNFSDELMRCQRYYQIWRPILGQSWGAIGIATCTFNNAVYLPLGLNVPLRGQPAVSFSGSVKVQDVTDSAYIDVTGMTINAPGEKVVNLQMQAAGVTAGKVYRVAFANDAAAYIALDANL